VPDNTRRIGWLIVLVVVLASSQRAFAVPVIAPAFQDHYAGILRS
jgi:hypothetical protein